MSKETMEYNKGILSDLRNEDLCDFLLQLAERIEEDTKVDIIIEWNTGGHFNFFHNIGEGGKISVEYLKQMRESNSISESDSVSLRRLLDLLFNQSLDTSYSKWTLNWIPVSEHPMRTMDFDPKNKSKMLDTIILSIKEAVDKRMIHEIAIFRSIWNINEKFNQLRV